MTARLLIPLLVGMGCASEPGVELPKWALTSTGPTVEVSVPAHLPVAAEVHTYRLATEATTTEPTQRCLLIPWLPAEIEVRFDDVPVGTPAVPTTSSYHSRGPHLFCADYLPPGKHSIVLEVRHNWTHSAWLEGMPRLVSQEAASREMGWRNALTFWTYVVAATSVIGVGLTYVLMFFLARRRRDFGWVGIQALAAGFYPLFLTGSTQNLGQVDLRITGATLTMACVASVYFTHEVFKLGRVPRVFPVLLALSVFSQFIFYGPFDAVASMSGPILSIEIVVVYQIIRLTRLCLKRSMNARVFLGAWLFLGTFAVLDCTVYFGLAPWAGGFRTAGIGLSLFVVAQVVGLSREFLNALTASETRATLLEKQKSEVQRLNSELKFQIAQRSKALAEALSKLGAAGSLLDEGAMVGSRYRVNGFLGAGAMGRVYNVTRVTDDTQFALKVMSEAQTGTSAIRFAREAEILCSVTHENVVSVIDAGVDERGLLFLVLELVSGFNLDEGERLHSDSAFALEVIRQVAEGLSSLHAVNIIHRDLKPGNILVANEPSGVRVKLTDFGISSFLSDPAPASKPQTGDSWLSLLGGPDNEQLTQAGTVLGTPAYIAPELSGTGSVTAEPSSDVFSLGVIAYELLTGKRPWEEPAIVLKLKGLTPNTVPLSSLCPSVPLNVSDCLMRALSWDRSLRPSAVDIARLITPHHVKLPAHLSSTSAQTRKTSATSLAG
jgi:hypothetical protein